MSLSPANFRRAAFGITTAAAIGLSAFVPGSVVAQEVAALNDTQCRLAKGATIRTLEEFTGQMSAPFALSLGTFAKTCDLKTKFERVPGQDDKAWDTFRVRMHVIRTSQAPAAATLAQN